jgi:hypothetical protein
MITDSLIGENRSFWNPFRHKIVDQELKIDRRNR